MRITTPSDAGNGNRVGDPTATTKGMIVIKKTKDNGLNDPLTLQPPPRPPSGTTAGEARHTVVTAGRNGAGGG